MSRPDYDGSQQRYPSVYVIQGYTGHLAMWRNRSRYRQPFPETADAVFATGDVPPALVVFVDARTTYGGSQFVEHARHLCARLLTPTKLLDLVMRRSLAPPQLRCFQNGTDLHPNAYLTVITNRRGQIFQMADMRRLGRLMQTGCTLVLDTVDTFDPTMEVLCRAWQWWSRELVHVNTYLTTQDATGFDLHWDDHDVLIVQLAGEKDWEVRGRSRSVPMYRDAVQNRIPSEEVIWSGTMTTGDVMHIPRGYWHQATRTGHGEGFSLHVTFGFVRRTAVDWLTWLADHSREDELFRHDLDRWGSPDEWAAQEDTLEAAASRFVASRSPSDFLAAREYEQPPHRQVASFGVFGVPAAVACVTEFAPRLEHHGETVDVLAAGKKITFAAKAAPALHRLLSGQPVDLAETTAAAGVDAAILAEVLVGEGICAELTPELLSLDPRRLRRAVEESAEDLCRPPDVVLLHNPERTLASLTPEAGSDCLAAASTTLHKASAAGLCGSWGISSWDTRPLLAVVTSATATTIPVPDVLMTRVGLLVGADILDAGDALAAWCGLDVSARWGMSPFAGHATDPVWTAVNVHAFLDADQECSPLQAAFRVACELPPVSRIAVGTNRVEHLRDLVTALRLRTDDNRIGRYRELLRTKVTTATR